MPGAKNKYIPYGRQSIDKADIAAVVKVLKSDRITQGPKIKEFEDALCKYTGAHYAVCVSSGTAALHLACLAAGLGPQDEVITSPITFVASANCVLYCGAKPVFADIEEDTANIDPEEIRKRITPKTKTLIPVHFAGHPCNLEEIDGIAKKHHLTVIEDAAHALGAEYKGTKIGSCKYSDMTVFSFHPVKTITTGEGGAIMTNRKDLYEKLQMLRTHGITKEKSKIKDQRSKRDNPWLYEMQFLGFNYRLTDIQAALGISQIEKLDRFIQRRRQIAAFYAESLSSQSALELPVERKTVASAWHLYVVRINSGKPDQVRRGIFEYLHRRGIGSQIHYIPLYRQPYYREVFDYKKDCYPVCEDYYQRCLSIPLYPEMKNREAAYVAAQLGQGLDMFNRDKRPR